MLIDFSGPSEPRHIATYHSSLWLQVGFLYLRYGCDPKELWDWYEPYIEDTEVRAHHRGWNVAVRPVGCLYSLRESA